MCLQTKAENSISGRAYVQNTGIVHDVALLYESDIVDIPQNNLKDSSKYLRQAHMASLHGNLS